MSEEKKKEGEAGEASSMEARAADGRAVPLMLLGFVALLVAIILLGYLTNPP